MGAGGALFFTCIDLEDAFGIETYTSTKCNFENCESKILDSSIDDTDDTDSSIDKILKENQIQELEIDYNSQCDLHIRQNNNFDGNEASSGTGDLAFWTNKQIRVDRIKDLCEDEKELPYLQKKIECISSPPKTIKVEIFDSGTGGLEKDRDIVKFRNLTWDSPSSRVARIQDMITIDSGMKIDINITILDE